MPSPAAALRVKISPMRMYRASISADLWPVWRMMSRSPTPFIAAWVTHPAQAMAAQRLRLQAGAAGGPLHDPADAVLVESAARDLAMAVDPAKDGSGRDARFGEPAAEVDDQAFLGEGEVGEVDRGQFRAAEGAGEADENERPVAEAQKRLRARGNDPANVTGQKRGLALLGRADRAADALEGFTHDEVMARRG